MSIRTAMGTIILFSSLSNASKIQTQISEDHMRGIATGHERDARTGIATCPAKIHVWNWRSVMTQFGNGPHGAALIWKERALQFGPVHRATNHALLVHRRMDDSLQNPCLKIRDVVFRQQVNHVIGIQFFGGLPILRVTSPRISYGTHLTRILIKPLPDGTRLGSAA